MFEILFQYGPLSVRSFNVLLAFGFLFSMKFLMRYIHRKKMVTSFLSHHFFFLLLIMLVCGRLWYVFENFSLYQENGWTVLRLWDLKISAFGVFYGGLGALFIFTKKAKESFWAWLDACTLTTLFGLAFLHLGHFFNGSNYGIPTELPWGIAFNSFSIPITTPLHPTLRYAAFLSFFIFAYGMKMSKKTHLFGVVGSLGIMLYSISAFLIDFLHGIPSLYTKINFLGIAGLALLALIHRSHQTYNAENP